MELFKKKLILAPMAGITEPVFRTLCRQNGADIVFSEMVSSDGICYNGQKTVSLLAFNKQERPIGIQLFGSNPNHIVFAARYIEEHARPDFIDLNCGCPVPKVVKKNGGAALLQDQKLYKKIITELTKAVSLPVTVKLRSGWKKNEWVDTDYAKIAEECGVAAVTLHPRSKTMAFSGHSLWERIALLKKTVSIPVIGNGDITMPEHALDMFSQTGCDSIMIGRGAYGNPWIFQQMKQLLAGKVRDPVSLEDKVNTALLHLCEYKRVYGEKRAAKEMKKHLAQYTKGMVNGATIRNTIFRANSTDEMTDALNRAFIR